MAFLWNPGTDVDFLKRLQSVEATLQKILAGRVMAAPMEVESDASENSDLRLRVDNLEELVIVLTAEIATLEEVINQTFN